jgi:hypothetical protein
MPTSMLAFVGGSGKRTSLLQYEINYGRKMLNNSGLAGFMSQFQQV